jgi:hypothetical protein
MNLKKLTKKELLKLKRQHNKEWRPVIQNLLDKIAESERVKR